MDYQRRLSVLYWDDYEISGLRSDMFRRKHKQWLGDVIERAYDSQSWVYNPTFMNPLVYVFPILMILVLL